MASGFCDIDSYDLSDDLYEADWTSVFGPAGTLSCEATADNVPFAGKRIRLRVDADPLVFIAFDGATDHSNVETLILFRKEHDDDNQGGTGIIDTSDDGYVGMFRNNPTDHRIGVVTNAVRTSIVAGAHNANSPTVWNWQRFRRQGNDVMIKTWAWDSEAADLGLSDEPGSWQDSETDSSHSGPFSHGIHADRSVAGQADYDYAWFGWATDGDTAPGPDSGAAEPPWELTVDTVGEGSVAKDPDEADYADESEVELTATPDSGWEADDPLWTGPDAPAAANENPTTITMDADKSLTANFVEEPEPETPDTFRRLRWNDAWVPAP